MAKYKKRQKLKRYRHSFYTREMKVKKTLGVLVLVLVVLAVAWLAAPHVLDWATHTWYTVVRDRDLPDPPAASSAVLEDDSASSGAASPAASSQPAQDEPENGPEAEPVDFAAVREGTWTAVSLSALGDEAAIRRTAGELKEQGVTYALVPFKDTAGYVYYASSVPAASRSVAASTVDPAQITAIFKENGLTPVAALAAFQDPIAAYTDRSMAIRYVSEEGDYLWLDAANAAAGGKPWLNPYADTAVQFIGDLIQELYDCGFEQVVLSNVQFPSATSAKQNFGQTGGLSRAGQLTADVAAWQARFEGTVTLWYEYPLSSCISADSTTGALPAQLGVKNLILRLPVDEQPGAETVAAAVQKMKELGAEYVVVREGTAASFQ